MALARHSVPLYCVGPREVRVRGALQSDPQPRPREEALPQWCRPRLVLLYNENPKPETHCSDFPFLARKEQRALTVIWSPRKETRALTVHSLWLPACLLRACVPACLRACVPACLRACVRVCVLACLRACVVACLRDCAPAWLRGCVPACNCPGTMATAISQSQNLSLITAAARGTSRARA